MRHQYDAAGRFLNAAVLIRRTCLLSGRNLSSGMTAGFSIARFFCIAGATLALAGLVLWWMLPISLLLPPYLFTAMLAIAYGCFCWRKEERPVKEKGKEEPRE